MKIIINHENIEIHAPEPLIDILRRKKIYLPLYCGGNGQCGKCLVHLKKGYLPVTEADRMNLTEHQLEEGYRLGCRAVVTEFCEIELAVDDEKNFFVPPVLDERRSDSSPKASFGIAVDIGTTTIAMAMVNLDTGSIYSQYTGLNHQRSYGTDVLARIQAAAVGEEADMQAIIQKDLLEGFACLANDDGMVVERIAIAGNTTMLHILRGYDCSGLGQYPFRPYMLKSEHLSVQELLGMDRTSGMVREDAILPTAMMNASVMIMPGISAFVGGDITAGLLACDFNRLKRPHLFLDLGTNAEMAIGCGNHIVVTSAAAGPAFEGGHLSCGIGSVPGAVRDVKLQYGFVRYETIGRKAAIGICGTGIVACMSEMLKNRCMNADGLLKPGYASGFQIVPGKIAVTQQDIREFQKAKAAIRAGIDVLLSKSGYGMDDIEGLDLAGGFGCQLDVGHAVRIGLIPKELAGKVKQRGNTVISGLIYYMQRPDEGTVQSVIDHSTEISLANQPEFTEKYLDFMQFPTEI